MYAKGKQAGSVWDKGNHGYNKQKSLLVFLQACCLPNVSTCILYNGDAMKISIRPWDSEDAMALYTLSMEPMHRKRRFWKYVYPDTFLKAMAMIRFYQSADPQRFLYRAIVCDDVVCGYISCEKKLPYAAEISYWLGSAYQKHGIMHQAVEQMRLEAFDTLNVLSVYALVEPSNPASQRVLYHAGFQQEQQGSMLIYRSYK